MPSVSTPALVFHTFVTTELDDRALVDIAMAVMARTLGIRSVAAGVETAEHLKMVREAGCDLAQGYLLARPMPAADVLRWATRIRDAGGDSCALALQAQGC